MHGAGDTYGVYGIVTGEFGTAVHGRGWKGIGVHGLVTGSAATGVVGENWAFDGGNGVWGVGYDAVYGDGIRSGVYGRSDQYGVLGYGDTAGGYFEDTDSGRYAWVAYGTYGILSNGTKSFVQPHPTDASKSIVYAVLEGGEAGTYYRGTAQLEKGTARVDLPEHFSLVTEEEGLTVQVTPRGDCNGLYVAEVTTTYIVVRELQGGKSNARFDFFINGVRSGYQDFQVVVDTEELGLDALDDLAAPSRPADAPQPPQTPGGTGMEGGGGHE